MNYYVYRLYDFLEQLARNNNREWFKAHKPEFDELRALWLDDIDRLIAHMTAWEPSMATQTAKTCAYRIYRDTRFSEDKTPYKTYMSAIFSGAGRHAHRACYYLQMDIRPEESGLYGGLWCPDAAMLRKLRRAIVDNSEEFEGIINVPELSRLYPGWIGSSLKTVPKGYEKDHPLAHLLRLKDYGKAHLCDRRFFTDPAWPERSAELFRALKPLNDFLNYSLDEDV